MKGVSFFFKKAVILVLSVCMTCAVSPWAMRTGYFVYADAAEELEYLGELDEEIFYVGIEISDWAQLAPLLDPSYGIELIVISEDYGAAITTGDLSKFIKLGKETEPAATDIPLVNSNSGEVYPTKVLPDYDPDAAAGESFEEGLPVDGKSVHSIPTSFTWSGMLTYVYPVAGETAATPTVLINHAVSAKIDGAAAAMLPYADERNGIKNNTDPIELDYSNGAEASVVYKNALRYKNGSGQISESIKYIYSLTECMLSTVGAPGTEDILGRLRIKAVKNSAAESGVEFEVYEDEACTKAAEALAVDSGKFEPVGKLTTGADGYAEVKNLRAGTYYVKRVSGGEIKSVTLSASAGAVVLGGGEGDAARVNKASVLLNPDWNANANDPDTMLFVDIDSADNSDLKSAAAYGGKVFVRSGGSAITATAGNMTQLGSCRVYVDRDGGASATLTDLDAAAEYINGTLLGLLDGETGRGQIKIEQKYLDEDMKAELEFSSEDKPEDKPKPPIWGPVVGPVEPVVDPVAEPDEPVVEEPIEEPAEEPVIEDETADEDSVESVDEAEQNKYDGGVRTADESGIVVWTTILIAGMLALILMLFRRKIR